MDMPNEVSEDRVKELLCLAIEGGILSWACIESYSYAPGLTADDFRDGGKFNLDSYHPAEIIPLVEGCAVNFCDIGNEKEKWSLTREKIIKGLAIMNEKYPKHYSDFINENDDPTTGDVFVQCCLFGVAIALKPLDDTL